MTPEEFVEMQARVDRLRRQGIDGVQNLFDLSPKGEKLYQEYRAAKWARDEAELKMAQLRKQWIDLYDPPTGDWFDVMSAARFARPESNETDKKPLRYAQVRVDVRPDGVCESRIEEIDAHPF